MPRQKKRSQIRAVAIGVSTGGVEALRTILGALPKDFPVPVLVVTHLAPDSGNGLATLLDETCDIMVKEADELETPEPGNVYLAPPNYHLQVESGSQLTLSVDPPVNFARPSVDVLFETAADVYGAGLIAVVLTGAGCDGAQGLERVQTRGGLTIIQDPLGAECDSMPRQALLFVKPDHVVQIKEVAPLLTKLTKQY
jgi:two-component system chemotaxis response regulator CheB